MKLVDVEIEYFRIDYELDGVNGKETLRSTWMIAKVHKELG